MPDYWIRQLSTPVRGASPILVTRFKWRADRLQRKLQRELNAAGIDMYRYEVRYVKVRNRWAVLAMQNQAIPASPSLKVI